MNVSRCHENDRTSQIYCVIYDLNVIVIIYKENEKSLKLHIEDAE